MKMMNKTKMKKKPNKNKKETKQASLTFKWVSAVAAVITVSFVIFSIIIYSVVKRQLVEQEARLTSNVVQTFNNRLDNIPDTLEISNVVPRLSPNTGRLLAGKASNDNDDSRQVFNDDVLASLANREMRVTIFDPTGSVVFSNGNSDSSMKMPKISKNGQQTIINKDHQLHLVAAQPIHSEINNKLIGYIVVDNSLSRLNDVLHSLRLWMTTISIVGIILFSLFAFLIVNNVVKPIKQMSKISRAVNNDPNSQDRMPVTRRHDELGELIQNFNQMLDRMQAYIQQQKQFVGDVSHELRTPVAVVQGHLNLLERWGKDDPEVLEESIQASLQEINRMKHLIQEMLDLTRAEQIDVQFPNEVTNVNEVLSRTINDMRMIHQDFVITYNDALKPNTMIKMYRNHLEQVLIILMDNAMKYSTDRKELIVDASTEKDKVEIIVQDFGEGISHEEQKKIFNRFYRVDKARTREKGGNGLGLSIAQKLVESYHGKISVISELGSGSKFKLEFPLLKDEKN
ncbi:HAMP domain-containing sensor histidine kinase [Lactobacillus sp. PV034]|uniref:HAMP domain-containing sensor histidine kinase n=1 Tax=Lactobacillus sp. PV034 TaxID=2594495 RepID=UPI00223F987D|nr:HAMP domain-containing histidine kinase [Lactobacillus sp. PV034]QNQ80141.1 HAMP domain-containing histidine kinase [Lactobacillus sp. PV034]